MKKQIRVKTSTVEAEPYGKWSSAKDFFPHIEVNQKTGYVKVECYENSGYQKKATVTLNWIKVDTKGNSSFIRGEVDCRNWINGKCSKAQEFCFAIFEGDSGHIYTHRAPATKGWMSEKPENIRKRLRKLGIGVEKVAVQQGDFLLKYADKNNAPDETEFKHETKGSGHHKFVAPILYADRNGKRFYFVKDEPVLLAHKAIDGIQHPDQIVEPGIYVVGTTANSLRHANLRD
jgi:hypothetical protein